MALSLKPALLYHADWGSHKRKRWCSKAKLDPDGKYAVFAAKPVGDCSSLIGNLRDEVGNTGSVFVGFDFPIGIPASYARRAGITSFREFLSNLGDGEWKDFYSVCDEPSQISLYRPFYPRGGYKGRRQEHLLHGHSAESMEQLLRRCERGGDGRRQACCLFWTLGGNQVGKAALSGWRDVLIPGLREAAPISLWPFDGDLSSLLEPGRVAVAETYPSECYRWFSNERLPSKRDPVERRKFGLILMKWAAENGIELSNCLAEQIRSEFPEGDDAFDAVAGLFGMLQVCLGHRGTGEPNESAIRKVEGWILGR